MAVLDQLDQWVIRASVAPKVSLVLMGDLVCLAKWVHRGPRVKLDEASRAKRENRVKWRCQTSYSPAIR